MKINSKQLLISVAATIWLCNIVGATNDANTVQTNTTNTDTNASLRDPFWPVGFTPMPETKQEEQKQIAHLKALIEWPKLKLTGITIGRNCKYATLEKIGIVEEGDIISVKKGRLIYRWRIDTISNKGISRTRLSVKASFKSLQKQ